MRRNKSGTAAASCFIKNSCFIILPSQPYGMASIRAHPVFSTGVNRKPKVCKAAIPDTSGTYNTCIKIAFVDS